MTDRPKAPWEKDEAPAPPQTVAEKAEAAAIRRRWITLGEVLAVVAVVISALTFWNAWSERSHGERERAAAAAKAATKAVTLVLKATLAKDGETLALSPADPEQTIQSQHVLFPRPTGIAAVDTTGDARIEAGWIEPLKAGKPHDRDLRVPIAITTRFVGADGDPVERTALYHLGYRVEGRLVGSALKLTGLSLIGRSAPADAQRKIDALTAR
ncbi:MAG: hypothetical protein PGN09_05625 [Sphingomonas fennica]